MPETGGPTTQSGILFQNSIAALYLGRLCDPRRTPQNKQLAAVRIEAPEHVDDIVVVYTDGTRTLVQAKESLLCAGEPWTNLWLALRNQAEEDRSEKDEFKLVVGSYTADLGALRESIERSRGKESEREWLNSLAENHKSIIQKVCRAIGIQDHTIAFRILRRMVLEIYPLSEIESAGVRDWLPPSNITERALFSYIRDLCGGYARIRKVFRAPELLEELFNNFGVEIKDAPRSKLEEYRLALSRAHSRIAVPGTPLSGPITELFYWPKLADRTHDQDRGDFEEEDFRFRRRGPERLVDLRDFPCGALTGAIINAGAGLGKTTLLRALTHKLALSRGYVPALIPLDTLTNFETVHDCLEKSINRLYKVNIDWLSLSETGRSVILFDGLDELSDPDRIRALGTIERFIARFPNAPFLLAVRDSSILPTLQDTLMLELKRLDYGAIRGFIEQYTRGRMDVDAASFVRQLERHSDLWQLARIPLYLAILVATIRPNDDIPTSRSGVLERYLTILFAPERFKERSKTAVVPDDLREAAELLAQTVLKTNSIGIDEREARNALKAAAFSFGPTVYVQHLIQAGILYRRGPNLRFHFPILQEYLAACRLNADTKLDLNSCFEQIARRPWAQALQFALETRADSEDIFAAQLEKPDDAFWTALRLIARSIINGARSSESLRGSIGRSLIDAWRSRSHYIRLSIGHLIADGFCVPLSNRLSAALKLPYTDGYGRGEIVRKINDGPLTLELLKVILLEDDIRELWSSDWQVALRLVASEAIPALLLRGGVEAGSTMAASVIATTLTALSRCEVEYPYALAVRDDSLPSVIRLSLYAFGSRPIPRQALELVDETVRSIDSWGAAWRNIVDCYLEIDGWQSHFYDLLIQRRLPELKSLIQFFPLAAPRVPDSEKFIATLRSAANDEMVIRRYRFEILLVLNALGDLSAVQPLTELLATCSEDEIYFWPYFLPYLSGDDVERAITSYRNSNPTRDAAIDALGFLSHCLRYRVMSFGELSFLPPPKFSFEGDLHPAGRTVIRWAMDILESGLGIEKELEVLSMLLRCGRSEYGIRVERTVRRFVEEHEKIDGVEWNSLASACMAADDAGTFISTSLLWRIIYQYPEWPVAGFVEDIAAREGAASHRDLLKCYEIHPSSSVRASIFEYFERMAPRLGIRVTEEEGKLLLHQLS